MPNKTLAMVLAGGEGKRLDPLTRDRAKPAVPFGGRYRIVDFVLSNLVNSGIYSTYVLIQFRSQSLLQHLSEGWATGGLLKENFIIPVPAQMRSGEETWFRGTADALYQNINLIEQATPDYVVVFGADHIYRMDPRQMVEHHLATGAGVTVAAIPVDRNEASEFGVIEADAAGRILAFHEKAPNPPTMPGDPTRCLASMGNYVFDTATLVDIVTPTEGRPELTDIGGDVIPALTAEGVAHYYDFSGNVVPGDSEANRGYWRDVGSIDQYYEANMDLVAAIPRFNLYNPQWPVYSHHPPLPPAKVSHGVSGERSYVHASLLCQGSIISGGGVEHSVLGPQTYIDRNARVSQSILFPGVRIEAGARVQRCIIDKNVVVPPGMVIGHDLDADRERFHVSAHGVVVIEKDRDLTLER